jgi:hypothetical protein
VCVKGVLDMEYGNSQMAAMQAQFEETIPKLREDLTSRLRVQEAANQTMSEEREEAAKRQQEREKAAKREATMGASPMSRQGPGEQGVSTSVSDCLIRLHYYSTRSPP